MLTAATVEDIVRRQLAAGMAAQSADVWNRFSLYRLDGSLLHPLPALSEMATRLERIEVKVNRLMGLESVRATSVSPRLRPVELPLPQRPEATRRRQRVVRMNALWPMYVPRVLQEKGFGGYESSAMPYFLAAVDLGPQGAFLDVGANVAPYSLLTAAFSDRDVIAFEPTPDLAQVAEETARGAHLTVVVERLAIGREVGEATLYLSDSTDSSNSLNPSFRMNSYTLTVPLNTLDAFISERQVTPAIVKIDVETMEPEVIEGAIGAIGTHRPWVFCEVLPGDQAARIAQLLEHHRYHYYHLAGVGPLQAQATITGSLSDYMWLFAPEAVGDRFWRRAEEWRKALKACPAGRLVNSPTSREVRAPRPGRSD